MDLNVRKWKVKVKVTQFGATLCDTMNYAVHGILQARILEWVAFPFSRESSQPRNRSQVSHIAGRFFTSFQQWVQIDWRVILAILSESKSAGKRMSASFEQDGVKPVKIEVC